VRERALPWLIGMNEHPDQVGLFALLLRHTLLKHSHPGRSLIIGESLRFPTLTPALKVPSLLALYR
jgi:hypothetical protein